jgi:hypothetical protein
MGRGVYSDAMLQSKLPFSTILRLTLCDSGHRPHSLCPTHIWIQNLSLGHHQFIAFVGLKWSLRQPFVSRCTAFNSLPWHLCSKRNQESMRYSAPQMERNATYGECGSLRPFWNTQCLTWLGDIINAVCLSPAVLGLTNQYVLKDLFYLWLGAHFTMVRSCQLSHLRAPS